MAAFGTLFVGFAARPVGAVIFGHFGDRLGRKSTLIVTLMLIGIGTFLIGCLPTYATIGTAAPVLLTLLRVVQGIGVGGEWGGAVLLSMVPRIFVLSVRRVRQCGCRFDGGQQCCRTRRRQG